MKYRFKHEKIGEVELRTRRGYGKIMLSIKSDGVVDILIDPMALGEFYPNIATKHLNNILRLQKEANEVLSENEPTTKIAIGDRIDCCNFQILVEVNPSLPTNYSTAKRIDDTWHLMLSDGMDLDDEYVQKYLKKVIKDILTVEARYYLTRRILMLSTKTGLKYSSVKINSAKQRWGSCSSQKAINLSCYLMLLSEDLIDYIIVHELCHTVEMNHSARFKALWYGYYPNYEELELKMSERVKKINHYKY